MFPSKHKYAQQHLQRQHFMQSALDWAEISHNLLTDPNSVKLFNLWLGMIQNKVSTIEYSRGIVRLDNETKTLIIQEFK